jgi:hypothetical protein
MVVLGVKPAAEAVAVAVLALALASVVTIWGTD